MTDSKTQKRKMPQNGFTLCLSPLAPGAVSELLSLAYMAFVEMFKVVRMDGKIVPLENNTESLASYSQGLLCGLYKVSPSRADC